MEKDELFRRTVKDAHLVMSSLTQKAWKIWNKPTIAADKLNYGCDCAQFGTGIILVARGQYSKVLWRKHEKTISSKKFCGGEYSG